MNIKPRLFVKKQLYVPTVLGWLLLLGCVVGVSFLCVDRSYAFLAYENPIDSDVFIIEGWVPDYVLDRALVPFQEDHCRLLITTGGPVDVGSELSEYRTDADLTAARLIKMGFRKEQIVAVPSQAVDRDRTYASAQAVTKWLEANPGVKRANLVTEGAHTRRSFIIFKSLLPTGFELGACAVPPRRYNPQRWWTTSEGFRTVVSEGIAYTYAKLMGPR